VTGSGGAGPLATHDARVRFRRVFTTLLRALASTIALLAIYFLLPLDRTSVAEAVAILGVGLLGLVGLIIFQVKSIIRSSSPALRGVGALATSAPLFLLLFAATYFVMENLVPGSFTQPMTRTDALYFTVTVFATVGFGDITAKSEVARALVTGQMVAGIIVVGVGARIIVDAIKHGREQGTVNAAEAPPDEDAAQE
jgi:voltage-gated potassium channel